MGLEGTRGTPMTKSWNGWLSEGGVCRLSACIWSAVFEHL